MTYLWNRLRPFPFVCAVLAIGAPLYHCGAGSTNNSSGPRDSGPRPPPVEDENSSDQPPPEDPGNNSSGNDNMMETDSGSGKSSTATGGSDSGSGKSGGGVMGGMGVFGPAGSGMGASSDAGGVRMDGGTGGSDAGRDAGLGSSSDAGGAVRTEGGVPPLGVGTSVGPEAGVVPFNAGMPRTATMDYPATGYLLRDNIASTGDGERVFNCHASCTVTLVSSNLAVTAAHCLERLNPPLPAVPLAVGFGQVCEGHNTGVQLVDVPQPLSKDTAPIMMGTTTIPRYSSIYHVTAFKLHPNYATASRDNDIAYLVLEKAVPNVTPATLPTRTSVVTQIDDCTSFTVDYDPMNQRSIAGLCPTRFDSISGKILVDGGGETSKTCFDDTGGPLYGDGNTLLGVLEVFKDCTRPGGSIYTSVFDHLDFVSAGQAAAMKALMP